MGLRLAVVADAAEQDIARRVGRDACHYLNNTEDALVVDVLLLTLV